MPLVTDEVRSGRIVRATLLSISTALIIVATGLGFVLLIQLAEWREHPETLSNGFDSILLTHFRAVIGLPAAALFSWILVSLLRGSAGKIEFHVLGATFKGASGPVVLWAFCFLVSALAIRLLW